VEIPPEAARRIADDHVLWLTTVADSGAPVPTPVWFVPDGDDLVVYTAPGSRKVRYIEQRPTVSAHFNSDREGGDVVVITGEASLTHGRAPSRFPGYLDKYLADIEGPLATTVEDIDRTYDTEVRIRPTRVRLT
jgi:PPOX class probable F420-dependent enzyme